MKMLNKIWQRLLVSTLLLLGLATAVEAADVEDKTTTKLFDERSF